MLPVCTWLMGEYGLHDVYLGVPAVLGREGVREVVVLRSKIGRSPSCVGRPIVDARENEAEETILAESRRTAGPSRGRARRQRGAGSRACAAGRGVAQHCGAQVRNRTQTVRITRGKQ